MVDVASILAGSHSGDEAEVVAAEPTKTAQAEVAETPEVATPEKVETTDDAEKADDAETAETDETKAEKERTERRIEKRVARKHAELMAERDRVAELEARVRELTPAEQRQEQAAPDVGTQARELISVERTNAKCDDLFSTGTKAFKDFVPVLNELAAEVPLFAPHPFLRTQDGRPAPVPTEALKAIFETDSPHKTIHYLGSNPDEAEKLAGLSGVALGKAMARLETKMAEPKNTVSSAPAPIKSPSGGGAGRGGKSVEDMNPTEILALATGRKP